MDLTKIRQEAVAAVKAFDDAVQREQEQDILDAAPLSFAERMKKGIVPQEHLHTFEDITSDSLSKGNQGSSFKYAVPANSDPLKEMFKGSDI